MASCSYHQGYCRQWQRCSAPRAPSGRAISEHSRSSGQPGRFGFQLQWQHRVRQPAARAACGGVGSTRSTGWNSTDRYSSAGVCSVGAGIRLHFLPLYECSSRVMQSSGWHDAEIGFFNNNTSCCISAMHTLTTQSVHSTCTPI